MIKSKLKFQKHLLAAHLALLTSVSAVCAQPDSIDLSKNANKNTSTDTNANPSKNSYSSANSISNNALASTASLQGNIIVSPAPSRTLSLRECFRRADLYNKEIVSAQWNLPISKAAIRIAGAIPNPTFQLQEGFGPSFAYIFDGQNESIGWVQQILTAGKRTKKLEVARANYGLANLQLDALHFSVHNRVRRAYAELAASEAYKALITAQKTVGLKLLTIADARYRAGKAPQSEVLQAKLNVSQYNTQSNQAEIRGQQDTAALALLIGEKPETIDVIDVDDNGLFKLSAEKTEIVPTPLADLPSLEDLKATAYASRPDFKAAQQQIFVSRKALTLAKTKRIPDLFLGGGYDFAQWARNQPAGLGDVPNRIGNGLFVSVSAETPVFYQYQGEIKQAIGNLRVSDRSAELARCHVAADVVTAYNEVVVARINIFLFQRRLLPTAADVARLARRGYQVGKTDLATAIVAQQQYQQTLSGYFDAVTAYQNAWADLEAAVGVPIHS